MNWFPINRFFAMSVVESYSGGVNELEIGAVCTSQEAADSLKEKIRIAFDDTNLPDISLMLTDIEAMCLSVASQNCATNGLPLAQQKRIDAWHDKWIEWNSLKEDAS